MEFRSTHEIGAAAETVFDAMTNPDMVARCVPGCDTMEPLGNDRYRATMVLGIAAIKGRFQGVVALRDQNRPESFLLEVDGKGSAGFAKGEARVEICGTDAGCSVSVHAKARVGGPVARVGQRLLAGTAKMIADKFFACMRDRIEAQLVERTAV